jgi:hypothetical protein
MGAVDMMTRMDVPLSSLASLWPVVVGAVIAGYLLAYAI